MIEPLDLPGVAMHAGIQLTDVISHLSTHSFDKHLAERGYSVFRWRRALQPYDVGVVPSEHRCGPSGAEQIRSAEDDARGAGAGGCDRGTDCR